MRSARFREIIEICKLIECPDYPFISSGELQLLSFFQLLGHLSFLDRAVDFRWRQLIDHAYEKGLMIALIPFTSKILEPCHNSLAYQPPNHWTMPVFSVASTPLKEFRHSETALSTLTCGSHSDAKPIFPLSPIPAWKEYFSRIKLTSFDKLLQQTCSSIKNVRLWTEPTQRTGVLEWHPMQRLHCILNGFTLVAYLKGMIKSSSESRPPPPNTRISFNRISKRPTQKKV
ncbi:hypothetical protein AgCh_000260 [Apium graveolens]